MKTYDELVVFLLKQRTVRLCREEACTGCMRRAEELAKDLVENGFIVALKPV